MQFTLTQDRGEQVEFELSYAAAMGLLDLLHRIQIGCKIPIPQKYRSNGRPKLAIVSKEDGRQLKKE